MRIWDTQQLYKKIVAYCLFFNHKYEKKKQNTGVIELLFSIPCDQFYSQVDHIQFRVTRKSNNRTQFICNVFMIY